MKSHKIIGNATIFGVALLLSAAGCLVGNQLAIYKQRPIKFNHQTHLDKAGAACEDCHTHEAPMPSLGACQLCHDSEADQAQKLNPFLVNGKPLWTAVTKLPDEVKFDHEAHLSQGINCDDCHRGIKTSGAVSEKLGLKMDDCLSCHRQKKAGVDCQACHRQVGKDWPPATHKLNWIKAHGAASRAKVVPPQGNQCSLCHTQSDCASCHQERKPTSHNNFWRLRGHGIQAEMDRESCATCHRTDYCDRCHANATPRSHVAGWGEPRNRHCLVCHFPLQNEQCSTCHRSLDGHLEAPRLPNTPFHRAADLDDCLDCHRAGGVVPMRHVYNGQNCFQCHRF